MKLTMKFIMMLHIKSLHHDLVAACVFQDLAIPHFPFDLKSFKLKQISFFM